MMNRTDEFNRTLKLFGGEEALSYAASRSSTPSQNSISKLSEFVDGNEKLIQKLLQLTNRKEFSNDPTREMTEISELFHKKIVVVQRDLGSLKALITAQHSTLNKQHGDHFQIIIKSLSKCTQDHVEAFKAAVKRHSEQAKLRQDRVGKYGQNINPLESSRAPIGGYAMFSNDAEVRRRSSHVAASTPHPQHKNESSERSSSSNQHAPPQKQLLATTPYFNTSKASSAKQVESSIFKMGELFGKMASLVAEQSDTISRIEDSVEAALTDTQEAHQSITTLHTITAGNRGVILKVFALLLLFIFIFLVWT